MAKKRSSSKQSKETIVNAAETLVRRKGATGITVDQVAKEAGCAKGLVHYHFKTKRGVLEAVAQHLASDRQAAWAEAFQAADASEAIDRTWNLLTSESDDGTIRAWGSLFGTAGVLPDETVSQAQEGFATTLGNAAQLLLRQLALVARIPPGEIGWLLGAVVHGMGFQILGGGDRRELEGAYAAAWLGILSLDLGDRWSGGPSGSGPARSLRVCLRGSCGRPSSRSPRGRPGFQSRRLHPVGRRAGVQLVALSSSPRGTRALAPAPAARRPGSPRACPGTH